MSDATSLPVQLQRLLEAEPELKQTLQPQHDTAQIVAALADAAGRHGLPLDTVRLPQAIEAMRQIGQLVQADPALQQDLQSAQSARQAAELIQRAARQKGLMLDAQDQRGATTVRELDDAELEHAAGGELITLSLLLLGGAAIMAPLVATTVALTVMGATGKVR